MLKRFKQSKRRDKPDLRLYNKRNGLRLTSEEIARYNHVEQSFPSDRTSIPQRPAIYGKDWVIQEHIRGKDVVDLGAGRQEYFNRYVRPEFPEVVPRDPFNMERAVNDYALGKIYDTAILSNVLNVIPETENIYDLLELAKTVADTTLITVYNSRKRGPSGQGRFQRAENLKVYVKNCEDVFGKGNVSVRDGVIVCESYRG